MERIWTTELGQHIGERVRLAGWLHRFRLLGSIGFLILRDGKGLAQIVVSDQALIEELTRLSNESVIAVQGVVAAEAQAPGGVEIHEPRVEVFSPAAALMHISGVLSRKNGCRLLLRSDPL